MTGEAPVMPPQAKGAAVVRDPTGLHARPAVKLTKLAKRFEAAVRVRAARTAPGSTPSRRTA